MEIVPVRAFQDNYIWLLQSGRFAAAVDPGDDEPVREHLSRHGLELSAILLTHHHPDHVGGVADLAARHALPVFAPAAEAIAGTTVPVRDGNTVEVPGVGLQLRVVEVPGHTRGHVAYYGANVLFCGDTLFGCGCGRLFEGTAAQMWESLSMLARLPPETKVYCAHEYTQANIRFALAVEPDNDGLKARARTVAALRAEGRPSVPSTLAEELATNPFLRCREPAVAAAAARRRGTPLAGAAEVFAVLREWKNNF
jgi:hydroxyacylglutathione hydrolase